MQTSVYLAFLFIAAVFIVAMFLLTPRKKKTIYVTDERYEAASSQYNSYLFKVQTINDKFTSELAAKQKAIILHQDSFAHQKCAYLVDEWNETSEITQDRLKSARNYINSSQYAMAMSVLSGLDKDIEFMESLLRTLKSVDVETIQMKTTLPRDDIKTTGSSPVSYFDDCKTRDALITRYKALAKVFHPDSKAGNEEIFREIKDQFDAKLQLIPRK